MKGEFENRLRQVIDEVQASPKPIILFIDEAHTLIGAGGAAGTGDAANLLKPALARGTLRTIARDDLGRVQEVHREGPGADAALPGRAGATSPSEDKAILMMRGVASTLEKHHRVQVLDEALEAAVRLSHRYIPARQLPDKAVSLLDTACARVAISQHAVPAELEDCRRRIEALETELEIIGREEAVGVDVGTRRSAAEEKLAPTSERRASSSRSAGRRSASWSIASSAIRAKLRQGSEPVEGTGSKLEQAARGAEGGRRRRAAAEPLTPTSATQLLDELRELQTKLAELQGESPLILPSVDEQAVASVVAGLDRHPGRPHGEERDRDGAEPRRHAQPARHRPAPRARDDRAAHPDLARQARQPEQADRRVHAVRPVRRRQDRDRAGAGRGALRRRAERHHHQHERVPGGAHRLDAQGRAARATSATARAAC